MLSQILSIPTSLGRTVLRFVDELGSLTLLVAETARSLVTARPRWKLTSYHIYNFGWTSQPVVLLTGAFVGMVFAAQIFWQLKKVQMENAVGSIVAVAMFRELGPTIAALMIAGRVGAAITAEIGTMRVTEQVDALRAMSIPPVDYLVTPRVVAMMISMPLLTAEAILMGIGSSYLLGTQVLGIDPTWFWSNTVKYIGIGDIRTGLVKGFFFRSDHRFHLMLQRTHLPRRGRGSRTRDDRRRGGQLNHDHYREFLHHIHAERPFPHLMSPAVIEVTGLHKHFGAQHVLRGVDLSVYEGESLVILGRSGGGKSVLLRHIMGLSRPDRGSVRIMGTDITALSERAQMPLRKNLGFLFQNAALFDSMTIEDNVAFPLREDARMTEQEIKKRAHEALEWVDLGGHGRKMPAQLSGGMRKRAGLARALVTKPSIMLYDEPTTGLDPVVSDSINNLILQVNREFGITSVVVTHDMVSAYKIAQRIVLLRNGTIYISATPEEIRASTDPVIYDFVNGISKHLPTIEL